MNTLQISSNPGLFESAKKNISYIFSQSFLLNEVKERQEANSKYHLEINGHIIFFGIYIYHILFLIKQGGQLGDIVRTLNGMQSKDVFSEEDVSEVINSDIRKLFEEKAKKPSRVKSLFKIMNPDKIKWVIKPLCVLYNAKIFGVLFASILLANGLYFYLIKTAAIVQETIAYTSIGQNLVYIICIAMCLIFHEIGHAVASMAYGVTPKKIGFGIYFIFPAFYTDLTDIWKLGSRERILINSGGIK